MNKETAETRRKLKQVTSIMQLNDILDSTVLSDEEYKIVWMHYKEGKPLGYIADVLGLSESTVKKKHSKALFKIGGTIR